MKKTLLTLATLCLASVQVLFAQSRTVKGTILDDKGNPVEFATVSVVGYPDITVLSDENGNYELVVPDNSELIEVEYIGYSPKKINITADAQTVKLSINAVTLDEGQVTSLYGGSGQITKTKWVGAGDRISAAQFAKRPISNVTQAIEGNAPGVQIATPSGQPGGGVTIRIRGYSSLNGGSDPLVVLDGAVYSGGLASINPNDVASMDILKDATATSLYGSRGANGVVVVTTKRGKLNSRTNINVDAKVGMVTRAIPNYKILKDPGQYMEFAWDAYRNQLIQNGLPANSAGLVASGGAPNVGAGIVDLIGGYNPFGVPNDQLIGLDGKLNPNAKLMYSDDWDKEMQRTGLRQEYNVSASGGSENSDFYLSLGYLNEKGYVKATDFERISGMVSVNSKVSDWLKVGLNINGSYSNQNTVDAGTQAGGYNPFFVSRNFAPIYPVYYRNAAGEKEIDPLTGKPKYDWGSLRVMPSSSIGTRGNLPNANVLGTMEFNENLQRRFNIVAIPYLEAKFLKNFTFKTVMNANYVGSMSTNFRNNYYGDSYNYGGSAAKSSLFAMVYTWNQVLSWDRTFNEKHNLSAFVGHENYYYSNNSLAASRRGIAVPGNTELIGAAIPFTSASQVDNETLESYFGQVSYNYDSKYFLNANFRSDGSSRFAPKERWGSFWSVGAGWLMNKEDFLKDYDWLKLLKLKASYGTQGNNGSGLYAWQPLSSIDYANGSYAGALINSISNPGLTWEKQQSYNIGVEFNINNRFKGEINYFGRTSKDQLYYRTLAPSTGIQGVWENVMTSRNSGIEFQFAYDIINKNGLLWNVDLNGSHFKNEIIDMPGQSDSIISGNFLYAKGRSIYDYYLVKSVGIDEFGNELYQYKVNGRDTVTTVYTTALSTGRGTPGSAIPALQGGFTNTLAYKGFDFSFLLTYTIGGKFYDANYQSMMGNLLSVGQNVHEDWLKNRWTVENTSGTLPKAQFQNTNIANNSDRWLISRTNLNIRNVTLGYTFSPSTLKKVGINSLRAYVSCDNVWLFTKRQGMDPQGSISGNLTGGAQFAYNPARTIMIGVNLGL